MSIRTTHSGAPVLSWCTRVNIATEVSLFLFFCLCYFFTFDFNLDLFLFSSCRTHFHSSVKLLLCCVDHLLSFTVWGSTRLCSYPLFNAVKTKDEPSCFTVAAHSYVLAAQTCSCFCDAPWTCTDVFVRSTAKYNNQKASCIYLCTWETLRLFLFYISGCDLQDSWVIPESLSSPRDTLPPTHPICHSVCPCMDFTTAASSSWHTYCREEGGRFTTCSVSYFHRFIWTLQKLYLNTCRTHSRDSEPEVQILKYLEMKQISKLYWSLNTVVHIC